MNRCDEWLGPFQCELKPGHENSCKFDSGKPVAPVETPERTDENGGKHYPDDDLTPEEAAGIVQGLRDAAAGRTKPLEQIEKELNAAPVETRLTAEQSALTTEEQEINALSPGMIRLPKGDLGTTWRDLAEGNANTAARALKLYNDAEKELTELRAKLAEQERLLHTIVLMVCDPIKAAKGEVPTPAMAVMQIIERAFAAEAEAAALQKVLHDNKVLY